MAAPRNNEAACALASIRAAFTRFTAKSSHILTPYLSHVMMRAKLGMKRLQQATARPAMIVADVSREFEFWFEIVSLRHCVLKTFSSLYIVVLFCFWSHGGVFVHYFITTMLSMLIPSM
jgi:hypothetical protein